VDCIIGGRQSGNVVSKSALLDSSAQHDMNCRDWGRSPVKYAAQELRSPNSSSALASWKVQSTDSGRTTAVPSPMSAQRSFTPSDGTWSQKTGNRSVPVPMLQARFNSGGVTSTQAAAVLGGSVDAQGKVRTQGFTAGVAAATATVHSPTHVISGPPLLSSPQQQQATLGIFQQRGSSSFSRSPERNILIWPGQQPVQQSITVVRGFIPNLTRG
jgi:hypothetical protein